MIPSKAVRKALAAHLRARLSLPEAAVLPDWPPASLALPRPVALTVIDAGKPEHDTELGGPEIVSMTAVDGDPTRGVARYRLGAWRLPLAVELWCATAAERDRRIEEVHAALSEPPAIDGEAVVDVMAGLTLTISDYFGAVCTFDSDGWDARPDAEGTAREEWRARFEVTARLDELTEKTVRRLVATEVTATATPDPLT